MSESRSPLEVVMTLFNEVYGDGRDVVETIADDALWDRITELFAIDAEINFVTTEGARLGGMTGPFIGAAGLRAGWTEWVTPYTSFTFTFEEAVEPTPGTILLLNHVHGTMAGVELSQASAAVVFVKSGLIGKIDHYLDQEQAKREAGL